MNIVLEQINPSPLRYKINEIKPIINMPSQAKQFCSGQSLEVLEISSLASAKFELSQRFQELVGKKSGASFIKAFAEEYSKVRQDLKSSYAGQEQQSRITLLDEVFDNEVNNAAAKLTASLEDVFDGGCNLSRFYHMEGLKERFDNEAFQEHLIDISHKARDFVLKNGNTEELEAYLMKEFPGNDSLEKMSYADVSGMADLAEEIPRFLLRGHKDNFVSDLAGWYLKGVESIQNARISNQVKDEAMIALDERCYSDLRAGAYDKVINKFNNSIKYYSDELDKLKGHKDLFEIRLKKLMESNPDNKDLIFKLLEKISLLTGKINTLNKAVSDVQEKHDKLEKDPDTITESAEYKEMEKQYQAQTEEISRK